MLQDILFGDRGRQLPSNISKMGGFKYEQAHQVVIMLCECLFIFTLCQLYQ